MKSPFYPIPAFLILIICIFPSMMQGQNEVPDQAEQSALQDESEVKAAVEAFLQALGNNELEKVKTMFVPNANIASIANSNGGTRIFTILADEYISQREEKEARKFQEPVREFTVSISQGILAFVRADATVLYDGKPSHHTNDFFILMKDNGTWKILSGSYATIPPDQDQ